MLRYIKLLLSVCLLVCLSIKTYSQTENAYYVTITVTGASFGDKGICKGSNADTWIHIFPNNTNTDEFRTNHTKNVIASGLSSFRAHARVYNGTTEYIFHSDDVNYTKGGRTFNIVYNQSKKNGLCTRTLKANIKFDVDDPVILTANSINQNINTASSFSSGVYFQNAYNDAKLQYCIGSKYGTWRDIASAPSNGSMSINMAALFACPVADWYDMDIYFRVIKTLENGTTRSYGNVIGPYRFYDTPTINADGGGVACVNSSITLRGGFTNSKFSSCDPDANLEANYNGTWVALTKKLNLSTSLSYADICGTNTAYVGKQIQLRAYKAFNGGRINTSTISVVYLPVTEMVFTPTSITCNGADNASFTLTFPKVPSTGAYNPAGGTIPLLITIAKYDIHPLTTNDPTYKTRIFDGIVYYYYDAITFTKTLSGTNSITINNSSFNDARFRLSAGRYEISARFNSSQAQCSNNQTFSITEPPLISATATPVKLGGTNYHILTGGTSGTINFLFSGGTPPYHYRDKITNTVTNLSDDGTGGTDNMNRHIGHAAQSITKAAGSYYYRLYDNNGCYALDDTATLIKPADVEIYELSATNVSCSATDEGGIKTNGTVSCKVRYGVAPYTVELWSNGAMVHSLPNQSANTAITFSNSQSITIDTGNYVIKVKDKLNPTKIWPSSTVAVGQPLTTLAVTGLPTPPNCIGGSDGTITLTPSGRSGYSYTVYKNAQPIANPAISNNVISALGKATYYVRVYDSNSCYAKSNNIDVLDNPNPLGITSSQTKGLSCDAVTNGEVLLKVTNTKLNSGSNLIFYRNGYSITPAYNNTLGGYLVQNLDHVQYEFVVQDSYCRDTSIITSTVRTDSLKIVNHIATPASCANVHNGSIDFTLSGGVGNLYVYEGADLQNKTQLSGLNYNYPNLQGGQNLNYSLNFIDDDGCIAPATNIPVNIIANPLSLSLSSESPAHCTGNNGYAIVNRSNGQNSFTYKTYQLPTNNQYGTDILVNSGTTTIPNLPVSSYTIEVTDGIGCKASVNATIGISPNHLRINDPVSNPAVCDNSSTGKITVSKELNTGFDPTITFQLSPGNVTSINGEFPNIKPGNYTLTAYDNENCYAPSKGVIVGFNANPVKLVTNTLVDQSCKNLKNGKLIVTASSIQGSQNYTITKIKNLTINDSILYSNTATYENLQAGTYSIEATDQNNCGTSGNFIINDLKKNPKPIALAKTVACKNAGNGSVTIYSQPNGSIPGYWYKLGNDSTHTGSSGDLVIFQNLSRGSYIITARDATGCSDTTAFKIVPTNDSVQISKIETTLASCIIAQNGKAKIVGSSFDKSSMANKYTFLCNGRTLIGDSVTFDMLPVKKTGTYSVTVKDQFGCQDTKAFAMGVIKDTLNLVQRSVVNASCPDSSSGSIGIRRLNGTSAYSFQLTSTPAGVSRTFYSNDTLVPITNLPQGNYRISVKDNNNCEAFINNIAITQPQNIDFFNYSQNYIKHKGQPEGQMNASVQLGNRKYNYEWLNLTDHSLISSGKAVEFGNIQLNNRLAGDYLLRVRDTANCFVGTTGWLEKQFKIAEPKQEFALSIKRMRRVSCFGKSDGEFELKAIGGWGNNYQYGFDALHLYADSIFSGRSVETVTMFAKDTSGVTTSLDVTVTQPSLLTASLASKTDANCFGSADGNASVNITGGNHPKYFVSTDNNRWTIGNTVSGLVKGDYSIYVRDSLNCNTTVGVTIDEPTQIVRNNYQITETRCGFDNGTITTKISGGIPGYTYQWYKGSKLLTFASDSVYGLFSGSYQLSVTDLHHCTSSFPFNVSDITDLTIDTIYTQPVTCWGYSDGKATAQLSKGNPPYVLSWPDSTHLTTVNGLKTGDYSLWVTDKEKCNVYRDFSISTPLSIYLNSKTITDPLCEGVNDGALNVDAAGSYSGFTYLWNNGVTKNSIKNLSPGNYTVTVTDNHNCSNLFDFALKYQQAIKPKLGTDLTLCKGNTFKLNPGIFSDYKWSSSIDFNSRLPEVSVNQPGNYFIEVTDNVGCVGRDTIKINQSTTELQAKLLIATTAEQNDTVVIFEASWPLPDSVKFKLDGCKVLSSGTYYRQVIFADTGTYSIHLTSYLNDCLDIVSKDIKVEPKSESKLKSVSAKLIQSFTVSPNPNNGQFLAEIRLREDATINLKLANLATGVITDVREYKGNNAYDISYSLNNLVPGTYILHLQAGNEAKTKTIIIQK